MSAAPIIRDSSRIKEAVATWGKIRQILRSGENGQLVPVVIPKERRGFGWLFLAGLAFYFIGAAVFAGSAATRSLMLLLGFAILALALLRWWRGSIIEIEQGTTGILSRFGQVVGTVAPGRHYLWWPWQKVDAVVDTSTEIPYTAPVLACPTRDNVPLKAIEFFLKFRIEDPIAFVRNLGASNFGMVLSSAVQDAIRQRSRQVQTERAYDLRGSDVGDMQEYLNRQLASYGVRITGANIPDVQLPDQYQQHLATRERVAKELAAYEREWELVRKQRTDALLFETERARKERDAKLIQVKAAQNRARQDVAQTLQERETEADRIRLEIEVRGQVALTAAQNEARALQHLGTAYQDNRAVLRYELAVRRLAVAEKLARTAPRAIVIKSEGQEQSALSTLILARMLPQMLDEQHGNGNIIDQVTKRTS